MTISAGQAYLLEQVKQAYEQGWRDGHATAEAEIRRAATNVGSQFTVIQKKLAVMREQLKRIPDHEDRIRVLESAKAKLIGAAAAVSALVSAIVTLIATHH
jgi:hypothetical protein